MPVGARMRGLRAARGSQMDGFEFRPVTEDELKEFRRVGRYVFAFTPPAEREEPQPGDNEPVADDEDDLRPEWTLAAFHRGRIVASSGGYPFRMQMNGCPVDADGVTAVGTYPGFRRRGLVRRLVTDLLHRAHDNGQPASILWASMGAIYQRFGYGRGSTQARYRFDPRTFAFQFGDGAEGYTRLLDAEAARPFAEEVYRRFISERNLLLHRDEAMWKGLLPKKRPPWCAVHFDADEEPVGYALYRTAGGEGEFGPNQDITVEDFAWLDMNGCRGLWEYLVGHDLARRVVWWGAPEDDPAPELLLEPRLLERTTYDGIWLRVVDARAMLEQRGYDHAGSVAIEVVDDPECPWNEGVWRLETDASQSEARRAAGEGDVRMGPHGLASLLSGHSSLSHLVRCGRATIADRRRAAELDALFATRHRPACMDDF